MINYIIFGNSLLNPVIKMWNVSENIRFAHATWLDKVCHANQLTIPYQGASRVTLKMIFPIKITFLPQFFFFFAKSLHGSLQCLCRQKHTCALQECEHRQYHLCISPYRWLSFQESEEIAMEQP